MVTVPDTLIIKLPESSPVKQRISYNMHRIPVCKIRIEYKMGSRIESLRFDLNLNTGYGR